MKPRPAAGSRSVRFKASLTKSGGSVYIDIPFDPAEVWGEQDRYFVNGTIAGHRHRGPLHPTGLGFVLRLGAAWRRDNPLPYDEPVEVVLGPDGPQSDALAADIVAALDASPAARTLFQSIAPFYRKNFIRWIEEAKRDETRAARVREMVRMLEAGQRRR